MFWSLVVASLAVNLKVCFIYYSGPDDFGWTFQHNVARLYLESALTNENHTVTSIAKDSVEEFGPNVCSFCHEIDGWNTVEKNWNTGPSPPPGLTLCHQTAVVIEDFIVNKGCNAIISTSFFFAGDVGAMAKRHPTVPMIQAAGLPMEGIKNVMVKVYQARYLSGIAVGRFFQANPNLPKKVGYASAFPLGETIRQINAVKLGLEKIDKDIKLYLVFQFSWNNARKEKLVTERLLKFYGVEAMFQHTDSPTPALTAHQNGKISTGLNSDMLYFVGDSVLTSPILVWGPMYEKALREYLDTGNMVSDIWWLGAEDGIETWRMGDYSSRVSVAVKAELTAEAKRLASLSSLNAQNPNDDIFCKPVGESFLLNNGSVVLDHFLETRNGMGCIKERDVEFMEFFLDGIVNDCSSDPTLLVNGTCYLGLLDLPDKCPSGTRLDITGCVPCGAGHYSGSDEKCFPCPTGTYRSVGEQITSRCIPCPPGAYAASPGSSECTLCRPGTYSDTPQMSRCQQCNFTIGAISFYQDEPGQISCKSCPENAVCHEEPSGEYAGLIVAYQAAAGFYKFIPADSTTGKSVMMRCRPPEACLGYDTVTRKQVCAPGMDSDTPLCGLCDLHYSREIDTVVCKECPPWEIGLLAAILAFSGYTTLLIVMNHSADVRGHTTQRVAFRMLGNFCALVSVALNATVGQDIFPEWFVGIWVSLASVAVDALRRIASVNCLLQTSDNYHELSLTLSKFALMGVLVSPVCVFIVYIAIHYAVFRHNSYIWDRFVGLWSVVTFVQFPFAATLFFSPMSCVDIDVPRMRLNYSITCEEAEATSEYAVAIIGAYCYCFGVPLLVFLHMFLYRQEAGSDMFLRRYGFFATGYRRDFIWWEPYHMLRKVIFLWVALATQHYQTKLLALLCLTMAFGFIHVRFRPYDARHYTALDRMELSSLSFVAVHIVSAALHYSTSEYLTADAWPRNIRDGILGFCWIGTLSAALRSYGSVIFGWFFSALLRSKIRPMQNPVKRALSFLGVYKILHPIKISYELMHDGTSSITISHITAQRDMKYLFILKAEICDMLYRQGCKNVSDVQTGLVLDHLWRSVMYNVETAKAGKCMPLSLRILRWLRVSYADMGMDGKIFVDDLYLEMNNYENRLEVRVLQAVSYGTIPKWVTRLGDVDMDRWHEFLCPSEDSLWEHSASPLFVRPTEDAKIAAAERSILPA